MSNIKYYAHISDMQCITSFVLRALKKFLRNENMMKN